MKLVVLLLIGLVTLALLYIRLAGSDPNRWHTDPREAVPGLGRFVVAPEGADHIGPVVSQDPTAVLARLDHIAMATPRTDRLAGTPESGRITYLTRSRWIGFPDYTTVAAEAGPNGTVLRIYARLRFGLDDLGVNRARVLGWLADFDRQS